MIIFIAFSTKTNKLNARIICKKYKHCAPVTVSKNQVIIYQFVRVNKIVAIHITKRDLNILKHYGWNFVRYNANIIKQKPLNIRALTYVDFTKRVCGIKNVLIQTPDALFKYLK